MSLEKSHLDSDTKLVCNAYLPALASLLVVTRLLFAESGDHQNPPSKDVDDSTGCGSQLSHFLAVCLGTCDMTSLNSGFFLYEVGMLSSCFGRLRAVPSSPLSTSFLTEFYPSSDQLHFFASTLAKHGHVLTNRL